LEAVAARVVDAVVDTTAREDVCDAAVPTFLLRRYLSTDAVSTNALSTDGLGTDSADVRGALGLALAQGLALGGSDATVIGRAAWLTLLVEATAVAEDERILPAAAELITGLQAEWPAQTRIDEASASVEACLRAAEIVDPGPLVQNAIDQLERVIGGSYRPGDGLVRERAGLRVRCSLDDHVRAASALLTAFELTGRLPYSMLAEELMAIAGREPPPDADIVIQCEAARVLCRLAALHDDPGYRGAAVIATGADYRADASRILSAQSARALAGSPAHAAAYGLAILDLLK